MASQKAVGFVGMNKLSLQMVASLRRHGYQVKAFEVPYSYLLFVFPKLPTDSEQPSPFSFYFKMLNDSKFQK